MVPYMPNLQGVQQTRCTCNLQYSGFGCSLNSIVRSVLVSPEPIILTGLARPNSYLYLYNSVSFPQICLCNNNNCHAYTLLQLLSGEQIT